MQNHPVAAAVAALVAGRDPQRLAAALTETARLRALLPGGPIQAHGREDVAACFPAGSPTSTPCSSWSRRARRSPTAC